MVTVAAVFSGEDRGLNVQLALWLWFTVLFANFAEAFAEGRGKAQAESLRKARRETTARRLLNGVEERIPATELKLGDVFVCEAGDVIPSDGEVIEGIASVDEAAITGESAPAIRENGGDRSAGTGGTKVLSDRIVVRVSAEKGCAFLDRMISLVEGVQRQKTPNEIALTILLAALTLVFLVVCATLVPFGTYSGIHFPIPVLVALHSKPVPLTATEYALLRLFVRHAGKVLTHRYILREVWGAGSEEQTHYLRVYMARLREKLEPDPKETPFFMTESGVGYRLRAESDSRV